MALTNKIEAIADAIREKLDLTAPLTLERMAAAINSIETDTGPGMEYPLINTYPLTQQFSAIGNAIRSKTGGIELLTLDEMPDAIRSINVSSGAEFVEAEGLEYKYYSDPSQYHNEYCYVSGKGTCTGGNIRIPQYVTNNGRSYVVCGVLAHALEDWEALTGLIMTLDTSIFTGNYNRYIGQSAFEECNNLKYINIDLCGDVSGVGSISPSAFWSCSNLTSATIKAYQIATEAFAYCSSLRILTVNKECDIYKNAFYNCTSLTNAYLAGGKIYAHAFDNCSSLTEVQWGDSTRGSDWPGTEELYSHAFANCPHLTTFIINHNTWPIGGDAPSTVSHSCHVEGELFLNCPSLTDIYVPWSEGEVSGAPWGAENATIHYNSGGEQ